MANNYTKFSLAFKVTPKACEWIETLLAKASAAAGDDTDDKDIQAVFPNWDSTQCVGFEWNIRAEGVGKKCVHTMWICDGGGEGDVDSVANFIKAYLAKFNPKGKVGFEWANTCSSQRVGEFGGGACVVTAKKQKWLGTAFWMNKELSK